MTTWKTLLITVALAMGSAAGCARHAYVAHIPPPPPYAYRSAGVAPGSGYVWIEGAWEMRGSHWHWVGGRWVRPPRSRAVWVPGALVRQGRHHHWRSGYWRR